MTSLLSNRMQLIKPSPTLAVSARASELKAQGKDVIGLGSGEPDFDTPDYIKAAAVEAIQQGFTKYTAVDGIPALKEAVIQKLKADNQLDYQPNQVIVSTGAKQSLFNCAMSLLNPGEEALIPAPYWVSYPDIIRLAGAQPVIINTDQTQSYKISPGQLEQAITPQTKLFIINSPSNPSGIAYSQAELSDLAEVLLKHPQITVLTDDIYEHIWWYNEPFANIVTVCPELYSRAIVLNGVSKAYAMTGWRIGYAAGPAPIIQAMKKIQSQSTSCPSSIAQKAALAALTGDQQPVKIMNDAFKKRHDHVYDRLSHMPDISVLPADGTFYILPNVQKVIDKKPKLSNDIDFAEQLLQQVGVALVPGTAFGCGGCIRISFATSMEIMDDALNRIEKFILD